MLYAMRAGGPRWQQIKSRSCFVLEGPWAAWQGLAEGLRGEGLHVTSVSRDVRAFLDGLGTDPPQVAILDVEGDGEAAVGCCVSEGLNLLREARKRRLEVRMLMLSAVGGPGAHHPVHGRGGLRLPLPGQPRGQHRSSAPCSRWCGGSALPGAVAAQ